ncbi:MAG TPA: hypothetical protein VGH47_00765 [Xanthobacteraceae bacterium]|jgi:hypothetical protein
MTSCTAVVDLETASDEDFAWAFQWNVGGVNFDFTGYNLMLMVRKNVTDAEVFISLDSLPGGLGGITFNAPTVTGTIETFNIAILRAQMVGMPPDVYAQSLVLLRPDGLREEVWNGTLTHNIGPTR